MITLGFWIWMLMTFAVLSPSSFTINPNNDGDSHKHRFKLKHIVHSNGQNLKWHIPPRELSNRYITRLGLSANVDNSSLDNSPSINLQSRSWKVPISSSAKTNRNDGGPSSQDFIPIPDYQDKATIQALATLSANAYHVPKDSEWANVPGYENDIGFGWDDGGIRGYIFTSPTAHLIIYKGTSLGFIGIGGPTSKRDKINDNLMFSCCCGHVDFTWPSYCDCMREPNEDEKKHGNMVCDEKCVGREAETNGGYYQDALQIFHFVELLFTDKPIWLSGHSLGGSLAALVAQKHYAHTAAVTFEAPGESLFARRIGIQPDVPYAWLPIFQFGHNADPVFIGECKGLSSACYYGGYALESRCHSGWRCLYEVIRESSTETHLSSLDYTPQLTDSPTSVGIDYEDLSIIERIWYLFLHLISGFSPLPDTVRRIESNVVKSIASSQSEYPPDDPRSKSWSVSINNHRISIVLDDIIKPWPGVPACKPADESCSDCGNWAFHGESSD